MHAGGGLVRGCVHSGAVPREEGCRRAASLCATLRWAGLWRPAWLDGDADDALALGWEDVNADPRASASQRRASCPPAAVAGGRREEHTSEWRREG